ncbi:cytochrome b [Burkholderia singularis]|uniref:cytochrome b n=1 Tax=Burkholderia singularis TaxID=1503053 RepID=UPI0021147EEC|nr:cytochrome b/b6 domain-containing protein [Burkholderia singularis]
MGATKTAVASASCRAAGFVVRRLSLLSAQRYITWGRLHARQADTTDLGGDVETVGSFNMLCNDGRRTRNPDPDSPAGRYDGLTRALHWIFAAIILYTMITGFSLHLIENLVIRRFVSTLNMSLATCLVPLFPVRYIWSFFRPPVAPVTTIRRTQQAIARIVHSLIYAITGFVLMGGILMVPDGYWFFGLFHVATPFSKGSVTNHWYFFHKNACYGLFILVVLHIGAALKHHFIERDGILKRML